MQNKVTEHVVSYTPRITKEQCQIMSDEELLSLIKQAQGHTKDFQSFMKCDFSYTYLTGVLRDRGYENGWYRNTDTAYTPPLEKTIIPMKKTNNVTIRQSYLIDEDIANEWKQFNQNVPFKTVTLGWALRRFMDDVKSGKIKFELEI